ncbi:MULTISPECIES: hypothetical protein [unclassified Bradyrhizobium]|uniref:hypothetical protein n=1 Tax=unclassified Bradyrhizobium TaxID=2631580 RepID=UPI001CD344E5|nr:MULTISPECIES: hypothetical protein [unclassified Bradyrhizobium]MCA1376474.1 hypothetical protein [Bradyrhizobium sp. IC4060]MCA1484239.1 hypothetical protein [Bradyrhizobium sp. IC4061]MCA1539839.1 hypothetical protein [Bradyrhizobium sp. NBAIM32]
MAKKRKSFSHGRAKEAVLKVRGSLTLRPRPKPKTPEEIKADIERSNAWLEEYLNSPEFAEECRKAEEKEKRREERRLAREAERAAAREERRRNPKSPIDAYYNHMEKCPHASGTKERRAWKKENPTFEFNGVTYRDDWSPQLSNSGKTTRWMGYLSGSDGSTHEIMNEHANNRRNDPKRNWGLPE